MKDIVKDAIFMAIFGIAAYKIGTYQSKKNEADLRNNYSELLRENAKLRRENKEKESFKDIFDKELCKED